MDQCLQLKYWALFKSILCHGNSLSNPGCFLSSQPISQSCWSGDKMDSPATLPSTSGEKKASYKSNKTKQFNLKCS